MSRKSVKHKNEKYVVKSVEEVFEIRWKIEEHIVLFKVQQDII